MRAAQDRRERAGELALDPVDPPAADGREVDDVPAAGLRLEPGAHRQATDDRVQVRELGGRELSPRGNAVREPGEQPTQLVEAPPLRAGLVARLREGAVVDEPDQCFVLLVRNGLFCQRSLRGPSS